MGLANLAIKPVVVGTLASALAPMFLTEFVTENLLGLKVHHRAILHASSSDCLPTFAQIAHGLYALFLCSAGRLSLSC